MLDLDQKEGLFKEMPDVLENVINLITYENQPLPTALRKFFSEIKAPNERNAYLSALLEKFSKRFCSCNPHLELSEDAVYILCFSLILLSVDLTSPAVRNKMSKREFIKNTRNALPNISIDYTGHLYDNIYLNGAIASSTSSPSSPWASDEENNNNNRVQQVIIH
jgi:F-box protein 8